MSGNTARGMSEVAGIGTGSKIHQIAHNSVTPAAIATTAVVPVETSEAARIVPASGPAMSVKTFMKASFGRTPGNQLVNRPGCIQNTPAFAIADIYE